MSKLKSNFSMFGLWYKTTPKPPKVSKNMLPAMAPTVPDDSTSALPPMAAAARKVLRRGSAELGWAAFRMGDVSAHKGQFGPVAGPRQSVPRAEVAGATSAAEVLTRMPAGAYAIADSDADGL